MEKSAGQNLPTGEIVATAPPKYTAKYDQSTDYPVAHSNETHITIPVIIQPKAFAQGQWDSDAMGCLNDIPSC